MRITKNFSREAIKLVATKGPPIAFEIEEGVADRKLGESRMHKLCTDSPGVPKQGIQASGVVHLTHYAQTEAYSYMEVDC
eukprot:11066135-Ditylum_brightwellii.AAC.1